MFLNEKFRLFYFFFLYAILLYRIQKYYSFILFFLYAINIIIFISLVYNIVQYLLFLYLILLFIWLIYVIGYIIILLFVYLLYAVLLFIIYLSLYTKEIFSQCYKIVKTLICILIYNFYITIFFSSARVIIRFC